MPAPASAAAVWRFEAIGTVWEIETDTVLRDVTRRRVAATIAAFDAEWSRFRADSVVSALARGAGEVVAPRDAVMMLDAYAALSAATDGAVNPLIGDALAARGYDAEYSLADRGATIAPSDWRERLRWGDGRLRLSEPAMIDVGALGKGRLVDLVVATVLGRPRASVLGAARASVFGDTPAFVVVDAGGDIAVHGGPVRIALEHPFDPRRAIGVIELADASLCASATNRRSWTAPGGAHLHHVLDARTGAPVRTIAATWAVVPGPPPCDMPDMPDTPTPRSAMPAMPDTPTPRSAMPDTPDTPTPRSAMPDTPDTPTPRSAMPAMPDTPAPRPAMPDTPTPRSTMPATMRADAISTALFFEGGPALAAEWGVEWVRMTTDGEVQWSPGNTAELFL